MSLSLLLDMAADGHGDRIALESVRGAMSFRDLRAHATGGAGLIHGHSPSHVVFIGRNGPAYPQVLLAAAIAGVPFVPLNYRLSTDHLQSLLSELENPLIVADADYARLLHEHDAEVIVTTDFVKAPPSSEPLRPPGDAPAVLLFTSGTTSKPKTVVLRHDNLTSYIFSTVEFGCASPDEAALVAVPPYHVAAVGSVLSNLYAGRRVVYLPDFGPASWIDLVRAERITSAMVVPTMLARIMETLGDEPPNAPALTTISYGGARMPLPVLDAALRVFPHVGFVNAYGLTETSSTIALLGPEDHREAFASADPAIRARLGSIGKLVPGIEARILGEDDQPVETGEAGALWVRGAQVSGEYRGQGSTLDADGWFDTRDLAYADADGFLYITGRADDTIIRGGENIAPAEIEDVLIQHPAVKDVAVVGIPDDELGELICAVVVPQPDTNADAEDLRQYVRARLRGSRTPDLVTWLPDLPYTPTGKLIRRQLVLDISAPTIVSQEPSDT